MHPNETLIHRFYQAFQQKDYKTMKACYAPDADFNDPVSQGLNGIEAGVMWEMLIKQGKDLELSYDAVKVEDNVGSAEWTASYTFTATKKHVVNHIKAQFLFEDGLIKSHLDHFDFHQWSKQALGPLGKVLGWTPFLKSSVQNYAKKNLKSYMKKKGY
ncbi:MAG: nuclear transport factor 2 family protein [Bacteroidota bacterium]